jgi:hypothetical protein
MDEAKGARGTPMRLRWILPLASAAALLGHEATAQTRSQITGNTLTRQTQTAFIEADIGQQTFESEAVESNATSTVTRIRIGGYAGENRRLGVIASATDSETPFELNDSKVRTAWREVAMQFRFGYVNPSIIAANTEMRLKNGTDSLDIYGTGIGGGLSINIPLTQWIVLNAAATSVQPTKSHDRNGHDVKLGRRDEVDLGASLDLVEKYVDVLVGYRYRQYDLEIAEETFKETQSAPYAGLRLGFYF